MIFVGKVVQGQKIASKFNIATANLKVEKNGPPEGVYIVECFLNNSKERIEGVMHSGKRKTIDGKNSIEVHLFNFSRDIYGEVLNIKVYDKLRDVYKKAAGIKFAGSHGNFKYHYLVLI